MDMRPPGTGLTGLTNQVPHAVGIYLSIQDVRACNCKGRVMHDIHVALKEIDLELKHEVLLQFPEFLFDFVA